MWSPVPEQTIQVPRSQVTVKTVLTVTLTILGVITVVFLLLHVQLALSLTLAATLLAVALNHPVEALRRHGLRRGLSIAVVMLAVIAGLAGILLLFIPPAVSQGRALVEQAPSLLDKARHSSAYESLNRRFSLDQRLDELRAEVLQRAEVAVDPALKALGGALSAVTGFVTVLFLIVFMLLFGSRLVNALVGEALPSRRERYSRVLSKIYTSIGGYLSGLSFICLVNACCTTLFLALIRIPFFLPLGVLAGLSSLIPLAGNTVAGVAITLVALAAGGVWKAAAVGAYFIVYQQFENHVLGPMVYRRTVNMNPLVIVLALVFFADLGGVAGALVAIPAVAAAQIIIRELLLIRREKFQLPLAGSTGSSDAREESVAPPPNNPPQHPVM